MSPLSSVNPVNSNHERDISTKNRLKPLLGASLAELTQWVQEEGQPKYRGNQLHQWIYEKGVRNLGDISVFPKSWRLRLSDVSIGRSTLHYRCEAPDGTVKYLLRMTDGNIIETVGIPTFYRGGDSDRWDDDFSANPKSTQRLTVCVSSQVGCPMACDFCATGKGGFIRNLSPHEIIDQVLTVREDFGERVSNVVFMGMGEPLLNLDGVLAAVKSLNQDVGMGMRSITISTVGIRDRIRQLAEYKLQLTLAVSLHASNQQQREKLIPSAKGYPLSALLEDCREYVKITGRRVTFEYILLAGLNDLPENAVELAQHLRGFQSHVNLIPYNPISEVDYQRPTPRRIQDFVAILEERNIAVSVRRSRGLEKDAACGQLRASKII
ncbi:MAG TPA: 23S rRNA (adenine(2503)-C(2))-methyltransferase RlmN [Cyanobacteria bacterium UBA11149]|nr:23S rRNA (adenine(2503)-C(2))-methyltransferase RlmN [Cyanobacteria bacterium UBA11367]HBE60195.1 23S rRNA (adenine(2503)-C(2))-methyltransferase RlmN [Cyanobacteria bacterium UBA11366]HBK64496.1 23S rRNA (adenine(2503)-C(2))-methyltransferase RlmN [Cyanobacteria bacterium UBA11166]HBR76462.1 23S rRNA (adenine(2503)-C(2))-methyltransferase RlmN [Cyanobacteria bacterium UBA11159]HBS71982.1 23S rRNA (adenine(2503)-C(2))-methyltransferase RlmN [Cyanobacteria bacterium UBA11153]HBW91499.1 23S r